MNIEILNSVEPSLIEEFRELVRNYAYQHQDEIDLKDVQSRIRFHSKDDTGPCGKVPDLMLKRLLLVANPPLQLESAFKFFIETFKFRTQYNLAQITLERIFPIEFFKFSTVVSDGIDCTGNKLFILRFKYYRKIPQFDHLIKLGFLYFCENHDREFEEGKFDGATLVLDLQDFDYIANYNFDLLHFMATILFKYRLVMTRILVHKLPRILNWILKMANAWVNNLKLVQHQVVFTVDEDNIDQFIAADQRPAFLYGTRPLNKEIPVNAVPFKVMVQEYLQKGLIEAKNAELIENYLQEMLTKIEE